MRVIMKLFLRERSKRGLRKNEIELSIWQQKFVSPRLAAFKAPKN